MPQSHKVRSVSICEVKSFQSHTGPLGGADLRFSSPLPDTSLYCDPGHGVSAPLGMSVYFQAEAGTHLLTPEARVGESN